MKPLPPKPPPPDEKPRGSWLAFMLAGGILFLLIVALTFLSMGYFALVIVIGGLMACVVLFHYLVWGWWLEPILRRAEAEEEARRNRSEQ